MTARLLTVGAPRTQVLVSAPLSAKFEPTSHVIGNLEPGQIVRADQPLPFALPD